MTLYYPAWVVASQEYQWAASGTSSAAVNKVYAERSTDTVSIRDSNPAAGYSILAADDTTDVVQWGAFS